MDQARPGGSEHSMNAETTNSVGASRRSYSQSAAGSRRGSPRRLLNNFG